MGSHYHSLLVFRSCRSVTKGDTLKVFKKRVGINELFSGTEQHLPSLEENRVGFPQQVEEVDEEDTVLQPLTQHQRGKSGQHNETSVGSHHRSRGSEGRRVQFQVLDLAVVDNDIDIGCEEDEADTGELSAEVTLTRQQSHDAVRSHCPTPHIKTQPTDEVNKRPRETGRDEYNSEYDGDVDVIGNSEAEGSDEDPEEVPPPLPPWPTSTSGEENDADEWKTAIKSAPRSTHSARPVSKLIGSPLKQRKLSDAEENYCHYQRHQPSPLSQPHGKQAVEDEEEEAELLTQRGKRNSETDLPSLVPQQSSMYLISLLCQLYQPLMLVSYFDAFQERRRDDAQELIDFLSKLSISRPITTRHSNRSSFSSQFSIPGARRSSNRSKISLGSFISHHVKSHLPQANEPMLMTQYYGNLMFGLLLSSSLLLLLLISSS